MAYTIKPGTGSLWVNDRKTEDKHPDRTGTLVMHDGSEYFIDGWLKETKPDAQGKTKKFLSLSVKLKATGEPPPQRPGRPQPPAAQRQRPAGLPTRPQPRPPVDENLDPVDPATGEYKF